MLPSRRTNDVLDMIRNLVAEIPRSHVRLARGAAPFKVQAEEIHRYFGRDIERRLKDSQATCSGFFSATNKQPDGAEGADRRMRGGAGCRGE